MYQSYQQRYVQSVIKKYRNNNFSYSEYFKYIIYNHVYFSLID